MVYDSVVKRPATAILTTVEGNNGRSIQYYIRESLRVTCTTEYDTLVVDYGIITIRARIYVI